MTAVLPPQATIPDMMQRLQLQLGRQTNIITFCPHEQLLVSLDLAA
jgi:hypothetical protein